MAIWNPHQGHNDRVRVGPAEKNLSRKPIQCITSNPKLSSSRLSSIA